MRIQSDRTYHASVDVLPLILTFNIPTGGRAHTKQNNLNAGAKLGFISSENITSMVDQMLELKRTGDHKTAVNILRLVSVLCAPGTCYRSLHALISRSIACAMIFFWSLYLLDVCYSPSSYWMYYLPRNSTL
jgi:hypothetical protein